MPEAWDVIVVGAGPTGEAAAQAAGAQGLRVLLVDKRGHHLTLDGVTMRPNTMAIDLVPGRDRGVAGVVLADPAHHRVTTERGRAIVLATGGLDGLYPGGKAHRSGDGHALAHRAGAELADVRVTFAGAPALRGGVADAGGATNVPFLFVAGAVAASRADGADVGARAARDRRTSDVEVEDHPTKSTIDTPLPLGFIGVKRERLQAVMARHFGPDGPRDVAAGRIAVHQLKGEADDFARARVDADVLGFRFACEMAAVIAHAVDA